MRIHITLTALVVLGCSPEPFCASQPLDDTHLAYWPSCGADDWYPFCAGGWDAERFGGRRPGTQTPYCDPMTGVFVCPDGSDPHCELDPWAETRDRYVECFDADGDGRVRPSEQPGYEPGPPYVACIDAGRADCVEDLETLTPAEGIGFGCAYFTPPLPTMGDDLEVVCVAPGERPRCALGGVTLVPTDIARPRCVLSVPDAVAMCGAP